MKNPSQPPDTSITGDTDENSSDETGTIGQTLEGIENADRQRREVYQQAEANILELPTSTAKSRLYQMLQAWNLFGRVYTSQFEDFTTAAIAALTGDDTPDESVSGDYDPVSHLKMDTLRAIGLRSGKEGEEDRRIITAITTMDHEGLVALIETCSDLDALQEAELVFTVQVSQMLRHTPGETRRSVMWRTG